jgi:hypothetical protein
MFKPTWTSIRGPANLRLRITGHDRTVALAARADPAAAKTAGQGGPIPRGRPRSATRGPRILCPVAFSPPLAASSAQATETWPARPASAAISRTSARRS